MNNVQYQLDVTVEHLPLKSVFRIARGAKTQADVVVVTLSDGINQGWAESVPYARYDESVDSVVEQITAFNKQHSDSLAFEQAIASLPAGAARNALDCALWDLQAKQRRTSVGDMLTLSPPQHSICAQTLSIDTPQAMAKAVAALGDAPLVKVKLDNQDIIGKMAAIATAAPNSQFIVDANEGWSIVDLANVTLALKALRVVLIEQPLPADKDEALLTFNSPIPLCADESCHTSADLDYLKNRYDVINIKLDKTGGLTEAVNLAQQAQKQGFGIMLGCMVGSSLAMAPAALLCQYAQFVDLDGPLLISQDRENGFEFNQGKILHHSCDLWGNIDTIDCS
jgi:L-alanine-DL-glutamate epimerase-like enolase superfamily enzyme